MLFNSYDFLLLFLTPTILGFFILKSLGFNYKVMLWYLSLASIMFYAQWSLEHLFILLTSIVLNYLIAKLSSFVKSRKSLLFVTIGLNLFPLTYYKYSNFLELTSESIILPLAISFFTFQQIAFQVDLYKEKIKLDGFREYLFFVIFFPQLIAGPIVHYNEIILKVKTATWTNFNSIYFQTGIILFSIGLFKKVVLGDNLASIANSSFTDSAASNYEAWLGLFAYSFQIYFDFSGYADMAIGLGLLFGILLPINFNSPYKSVNIVEFWRKWHITLSNFLKDYIYIPLGGNRLGDNRAVINILITMIIGGIWHGAGWTFLLWGLLHGVLLGAVHLFKNIYIYKYISIFITFLIVTLLWVLFRAESLELAMSYYRTLFDFQSVDFSLGADETLVLFSLFIVWFLPNSSEFARNFQERPILFLVYSLSSGVMFFVSLKVMATMPAQTFVYFNF